MPDGYYEKGPHQGLGDDLDYNCPPSTRTKIEQVNFDQAKDRSATSQKPELLFRSPAQGSGEPQKATPEKQGRKTGIGFVISPASRSGRGGSRRWSCPGRANRRLNCTLRGRLIGGTGDASFFRILVHTVIQMIDAAMIRQSFFSTASNLFIVAVTRSLFSL